MRVQERVWCRVGPLTHRTKADDRVESGMFGGVRLKSCEYIVIANREAISAGTIGRRLVPERWANPEEITSVLVSGHGTQADTGKRRQFDLWESGVGERTNLTKHPFPSRLLKQDSRRECT